MPDSKKDEDLDLELSAVERLEAELEDTMRRLVLADLKDGYLRVERAWRKVKFQHVQTDQH